MNRNEIDDDDEYCSMRELRKLLECEFKRPKAWYESKLFCILLLAFLRLCLIAECAFFLYIYVCSNGIKLFLFIIILALLIVIETLYLCARNGGRDFYWFSIGITAYMAFCLTLAWSSSAQRQIDADDACLNQSFVEIFSLKCYQVEFFVYSLLQFTIIFRLFKLFFFSQRLR